MPEHLDLHGYLVTVEQLNEELHPQGFRVVAEWRLKMVTVQGYMDRYFTHMGECPTNSAAWEKTEAEFQETFGRQRFDNYLSFRNSSQIKKYLKK